MFGIIAYPNKIYLAVTGYLSTLIYTDKLTTLQLQAAQTSITKLLS